MNDKDVPHALTVSPESVLHFTLTRSDNDGTSAASSSSSNATKCTMTLSHTSGTASHLAFKVKTTQPRRYLVRPNQGIIAPGQSETVTILLVEKDKHTLLESYDRLGQNGLDNSKDKFLVQSCAVDTAFAKQYLDQKAQLERQDSKNKGLADKLTGMWNQASSGSVEIHNKKLQVRHKVVATATANSASVSTSRSKSAASSGSASVSNVSGSGAPPTASEKVPPKDMTPQQLLTEITSLRRKYDELVSFSVNLTAERDILNNTLEQTKRDLNREMAARSALENDLGNVASHDKGGSKPSGMVLILMIVFCFVSALLGMKAMQIDGFVETLEGVPVLGDLVKLDMGISLKDVVQEGVVGDELWDIIIFASHKN